MLRYSVRFLFEFTLVGDETEKLKTLVFRYYLLFRATITRHREVRSLTHRLEKLQTSCGFDWHFTQISVTSCFLSLIPSKTMYSLPGEWSLISCQVIVCCFHCTPCCCTAGYVISSQSQTEVIDHLSIHQTPAAERDHLVLTKRSKLCVKKTSISYLITNITGPEKTKGSLDNLPVFSLIKTISSDVFIIHQ